MVKVKVLIEGYTSGETNGKSCSTVILVQDKGINMIVDPGTLPVQQLLTDKLKKEGLDIKDIDIVFITHTHIDHCMNMGMFPNAKVLVKEGYWKADFWSKADEITPNIKLISTPGHSDDSMTLLVKTEKGIVAICGDVFWKENFPEHDKYAVDMKQLIESRKKILKAADYIIPGHGGMFRVRK